MLCDLPAERSRVAFSDDGRTLACEVGNTVRLWNLAGSSERLTLSGQHVWGVQNVAFSPDGSTLASTGYDGCVKLCDPTTGPLRRPRALSARASGLRFQPRWLVARRGLAERMDAGLGHPAVGAATRLRLPRQVSRVWLAAAAGASPSTCLPPPDPDGSGNWNGRTKDELD